MANLACTKRIEIRSGGISGCTVPRDPSLSKYVYINGRVLQCVS